MDLKIKEVADLLNVSESTIYRWIENGTIPSYKIKDQYRFNRGEIEDWVLNLKSGKTQEETLPFNEREGATKGGLKQYSLYRAIHKGNILHNVPGKTKEEIIRYTMKLIAKDHHLDADVLSELLLDRENLQPTALNHGIGIPHTRDFLLNDHYDVVTIVFPMEPIPYGALDGEPVHTFFFLFACDDKRHLHLLAKIAHLSSHPHAIEFLCSKPTKETCLDFVKNWEGSIQR